MIVNTILSWAIPVILAGILSCLVKIYKDSKAMKQAMISLLRSQIVGKVEGCIELGYLNDSVRQCLDDLFTQYTTLGGNHGIAELVEQAYNLPPQKKRGKKYEKVMEQ